MTITYRYVRYGSLYSRCLWRPGRYRFQRQPDRVPYTAGCTHSSTSSAPDVNITARRSADSSLSLGWLNIQSLSNKTDAVEELISERAFDVLSLTETWHSASDDVCLRLATPAGYAVVEAARRSGRDGGVAIIFRKHMKCVPLPLPTCDTFEAVCVRLATAEGPTILLNLSLIHI